MPDHNLPATDDIFLSPRVVDEAAFEDFAAKLRGVVEDASASAQTLASLRAELNSGHAQQAAEAIAAQRKEIDALRDEAVARRDEVRALLERLDKRADDVESFENTLDNLLEQRAAAFRDRLNQMFEGAETEIEKRVAAHREGVDEVLSALQASRRDLAQRMTDAMNDARTQLESLVNEARELAGADQHNPGRLADLLQQARGAQNALASTQADIETARTQAHEAADRVNASLRQGRSEIDEFVGRQKRLEESLRKAIRASTATEKTLSTQAEHAQQLTATLEQTRAAVDEASRRLTDDLDRGESLHKRQTDTRRETDEALQRVRALLETLEPWRPLLLDRNTSDPLPAPLAALVEDVRAGIATDLAQMADAMGMIAGRVRSAGLTRHAEPHDQAGPRVTIQTEPKPATPVSRSA